MSSAIVPPAAGAASPRAQGFFEATIVKKAVMAITGVVLFLFVTGHLLGNLQVFLGPDRLNSYAAFLKGNLELLWGTRITLLVCVTAHIVSTIQLASLKKRARPVAYARKDNAHSSIASRSMYITGPMIAAFVLYHLLHLTLGAVHPQFSETDVYSNVVYGFEQWPVALTYIIAMALLCLHLNHGIFSMFQSLGILPAQYMPRIRTLARVISVLYFAGYCSIPVAALTGVLAANGPVRL
ncbi:MAG: succinate dehydrogenase cytochrome b subunit [Acidobacteriota bacterium]|nr:succinate dehydrogenase cytochrome b subunit [Acidobacteriota bacterium]